MLLHIFILTPVHSKVKDDIYHSLVTYTQKHDKLTQHVELDNNKDK